MKWVVSCAVALALVLGFPGRADAVSKHFSRSLVAQVEIGADGRVASLQWQDDKPALKLITQRIEPHVRQWRFEPGAIDGVPQPTRTHLTVQVHGEQQGDTLALRLGRVSTGAKSTRMAAPPYPPIAVMDGIDASLVALVTVSPEGRVSIDSLDYTGRGTYRKHFVAAVEAALRASSFAPEQVGGRAVAGRLRIPYEFCSSRTCIERMASATSDVATQGGPSGEPVALESVARLLTAVEGEAI